MSEWDAVHKIEKMIAQMDDADMATKRERVRMLAEINEEILRNSRDVIRITEVAVQREFGVIAGITTYTVPPSLGNPHFAITLEEELVVVRFLPFGFCRREDNIKIVHYFEGNGPAVCFEYEARGKNAHYKIEVRRS